MFGWELSIPNDLLWPQIVTQFSEYSSGNGTFPRFPPEDLGDLGGLGGLGDLGCRQPLGDKKGYDGYG